MANKMDNLEEMEKFLEKCKILRKYNLSKVNQEEIESSNSPITSTEIETVIENSNKQKPRTRWLHR